MTLEDAQQLALYMGVRWSELSGDQLEHAEQMRYRNVVQQKKAGDRVQLRAKCVARWESLIKS
jgi:hypothetical protein